MNSDRPDSNPEPAQFALECCSMPVPQVEQPVGHVCECKCGCTANQLPREM